jgi:Flp pilus assembly pilin Flp
MKPAAAIEYGLIAASVSPATIDAWTPTERQVHVHR